MDGDQDLATQLQSEAFAYWDKLADSPCMPCCRYQEMGALHFAMAVHRLKGFEELQERRLAAESFEKALSVCPNFDIGWNIMGFCVRAGYESYLHYTGHLSNQNVPLHSLKPWVPEHYWVLGLVELGYCNIQPS